MSELFDRKHVSCDGYCCERIARLPVALRQHLDESEQSDPLSSSNWLFVQSNQGWKHFCPPCAKQQIGSLMAKSRPRQNGDETSSPLLPNRTLSGPSAQQRNETPVFNKIILCVDGSECSKHAAEATTKLAKQFNSEVVLTNVAAEPPIVSTGAVAIEPELTTEAGLRIENDQYVQRLILDSAKLSLEGAGVTPRTMPLAGHAVDEIVELAEREEADLIILGSRGLGGFQRLLLGSVSDGVLHHARCPVMIVR